jgi:hypothetical protein
LSEKLFRFYTPKDALVLLGKTVNVTNEIDLFRNLKTVKEYYVCDDGEESIRGYFVNIEDAIHNPNKFKDFININDEEVEFIWVSEEHVDSDGQIMESAKLDNYVIEEISKNWAMTSKFEGKYRFIIKRPSIASFSYSSCVIDNFSVCQMHLLFSDIYAAPKKLAKYSEILASISRCDDEEEVSQDKKMSGVDFSNDGLLIIKGNAFKASDVEKKAIGFLYNYQLQNNKGATNFQIFKDIDHIKKKAMANVIAALDTNNPHQKFKIRDCFSTIKDGSRVIYHFKIPDHW